MNGSNAGLFRINRELKAMAGRDNQLWGIGLFVMTALLLGMLALVVCIPGYVAQASAPQLVTGLVALLVLLNAYLVSQKRTLHHATELLLQQATSDLIAQKYSFMDTETQVFTREYLDFALGNEIMSVHRNGTALTLLMVRVEANGVAPENADVIQAARLLRSTFRGSDTLVRYDERDFAVLMPETSEDDAKNAVQRLFAKTEHWNVSAAASFELTLTYKMRGYRAGEQAHDCLRALQDQADVFKLVSRRPLHDLSLARTPAMQVQ